LKEIRASFHNKIIPATCKASRESKLFKSADTSYEQPLKDLRQAMAVHRVEEGKIVPLMAGESWLVP
jgi:hypothetical protein